jgi:uncharacterized membrane protein YbhN (UPF0104 family)
VPSLFTLIRFYLYGWLLNCAVPAKLGELYRGYLVQRRSRLPLATVLGTVLVERSADLVVLALLLPILTLPMGLATSGQVLSLQVSAAGLSIVLLATLVLVRRFPPFLRRLPLSFRRALLGLAAGLALERRKLLHVTLLTLPLWFLEGVRVYAEARALNLPLALFSAFLIALLAALLTTVPLTPAGIGAVEIGIAGTLLLLGFPREQAVALALLDRLVAYWSVFLFAGIPWIVERLRGS